MNEVPVRWETCCRYKRRFPTLNGAQAAMQSLMRAPYYDGSQLNAY